MSDIQTGLTPGRKIKAAMWMSIWVTASGGFLSYIGAPEEISKYVLGITGLGWVFTIGGQTLVDAVKSGLWNVKPDVSVKQP